MPDHMDSIPNGSKLKPPAKTFVPAVPRRFERKSVLAKKPESVASAEANGKACLPSSRTQDQESIVEPLPAQEPRLAQAQLVENELATLSLESGSSNREKDEPLAIESEANPGLGHLEGTGIREDHVEAMFDRGPGIPGMIAPSPYDEHAEHAEHKHITPKDSLEMPSARPIHQHERNITFGGDTQSSSPSPAPPQSVSSTTQTHPTPLSETTSIQVGGFGPGFTYLQACDPMARSLRRSPPLSPPPLPRLLPLPNGVGPALTNGYHHPPLPPMRPPPTAPEPSVPEDVGGPRDYWGFNEPIGHHIIDNFNDPRFADVVLRVRLVSNSMTLMLHGLLIGRSPVLAAMLVPGATYDVDSSGRKQLNYQSHNIFVTGDAFVAALRTCYGEPPALPRPRAASGNLLISPLDQDAAVNRALAYVSAGLLLDLPAATRVGTREVLHNLNVASIEKILVFIYQGAELLVEQSPLSTEVGTQLTTNLSGSHRLYHVNMLPTVVSFLTPFFLTLDLDTSAPGAPALGAFPRPEPTPTAAPSRSTNPRLRGIVFGSFPGNATSPGMIGSPATITPARIFPARMTPAAIAPAPVPDRHRTRLSTILLSAPFVMLRMFLEHVHNAELVRAVVAERERRRTSYLRAFGTPMSAPIAARAGWREQVEVVDHMTRIARTWAAA